MVAREPTASRAAAELNFIVDVLNIKSNDHLDVGVLFRQHSERGMKMEVMLSLLRFQVPSAEERS